MCIASFASFLMWGCFYLVVTIVSVGYLFKKMVGKNEELKSVATAAATKTAIDLIGKLLK